MNDETSTELTLSILITVTSGKETVRRCLAALLPQTQPIAAEILVPYDAWAMEIEALMAEFPEVRFPLISDLGIAASADIPAHRHRLCDRRRAVGLGLARGRVIAMTEDQIVPAPDWVEQVLAAHQRHTDGVIGGSIDNAVDHPLHWAAYYCDHGRYGSPLAPTPAEYVSDLNISYKHEAMEGVREVWREAYSETTVHWALRDRGVGLRLDPALKVYKHRAPFKYFGAIGERAEWGRVFAETRVADIGPGRRMFFVLMTPLLPTVLLGRAFRHMRRQRRTLRQMAAALPLTLGLLVGWAWGELTGYVLGAPRVDGQWRAIPGSRISQSK